MFTIRKGNETDCLDPTYGMVVEDTERRFRMRYYGEVDIEIGKGRVWLYADDLEPLLAWACGFGDADHELSCDSNNPTFTFRRTPAPVNGVFGTVESDWGGMLTLSEEDIVVIRNFLEKAIIRNELA